jgi:hypothetical protein
MIVAIRRAIACSWRARHEVPGKRPPKESSRRVRYDRTLLIPGDNWGGGTATPISVLQGGYLKRGHRTEDTEGTEVFGSCLMGRH